MLSQGLPPVPTVTMTSTWSTVVLLSLTCSLTLAIHDHVLESANNDFTGFKVDTVTNWTLAQHSYHILVLGLQNTAHHTAAGRLPGPAAAELQGILVMVIMRRRWIVDDTGEERKEEKIKRLLRRWR